MRAPELSMISMQGRQLRGIMEGPAAPAGYLRSSLFGQQSFTAQVILDGA